MRGFCDSGQIDLLQARSTVHSHFMLYRTFSIPDEKPRDRSMRPRRPLTSDEGQQVRIDYVGVSGHQTVREARINLERRLLEQFRLQQ